MKFIELQFTRYRKSTHINLMHFLRSCIAIPNNHLNMFVFFCLNTSRADFVERFPDRSGEMDEEAEIIEIKVEIEDFVFNVDIDDKYPDGTVDDTSGEDATSGEDGNEIKRSTSRNSISSNSSEIGSPSSSGGSVGESNIISTSDSNDVSQEQQKVSTSNQSR